MKQIVLILLFILTLQKNLHTGPPKDFPKDLHPYKRSFIEFLLTKIVLQDIIKIVLS